MLSSILFGFLLTNTSLCKNSFLIKNSIDKKAETSLKISSFENFGRIINEFRINNYTLNSQDMCAICALSSDKFVVTWQSEEQGSSGKDIYASVFNATTGNNVTAEFRVNEISSYIQEKPSICALSNDTFAIAWTKYLEYTLEYDVFAKVFNATTGKNITSEFRVNHYTPNTQFLHSICALSSDKFAVTWQSAWQDGTSFSIYARVFNATTGNNITAEFRVNNPNEYSQSGPGICSLTNDTFIVGWSSYGQDGSRYGVYAKIFNTTTGNNITSEFRINHLTTDDQISPSLCALSNDTFAVTWYGDGLDSSGNGIYARVFNATTGNNITSEFQVNHYILDDQEQPSICALSNDTFAVTWMSENQDGSSWGVYARVFNATTGNNITSEFRANNYTMNTQDFPSICALSNDTFVITWRSSGQDGSGMGVFASLFGPLDKECDLNINPQNNDDDDDNNGKESIDNTLQIIIIASTASLGGAITIISIILIKKHRIKKFNIDHIEESSR